MTQLLNAEIEDEGEIRPTDPHRGAHVHQHGRGRRQRDNYPAHRLHRCSCSSDHPDQRRNSSPTLGLIPGAIEEVLRYRGAVAGAGALRRPRRQCRGEQIPEGSIMLLLNGSANRDERHLPGRRAFRHPPQRRDILSFGQGLHFCLGFRAGAHAGTCGDSKRCSSDGRTGKSTTSNAAMAHTSSVRGWGELPATYGLVRHSAAPRSMVSRTWIRDARAPTSRRMFSGSH